VNEIHLGLTIDIPPGYAIQVKNHLCNKPWRVYSEFLYPNKYTRCINIPIITKKVKELKAGEVLCHIKFINLSHALEIIKGKNYLEV
jgi:hypothetical protein